ncbi:hypothetical protein DM860_016564 [Cuscuta australis]|uniref:Ubiquitin-like protease family profile domain-containing protein n=1 Tax=Cuscuta australis TaxID=267555 RepID=A0A328DNU3_9ASTE|nr:hypothetical protein DM860_016564 [Cuscuta australis]
MGFVFRLFFTTCFCVFFIVIQHVEIAMYFLEVKGRQYDLLQTYTTTTPYFLQGLYKHQEMVNVGKAKKEDVINNMNLTTEVKGLAREYSRPWSECDFVYMPLNTGDHWVLLVLEVEGRTIRVYDSKGKKGKTCRALNMCMTSTLVGRWGNGSSLSMSLTGVPNKMMGMWKIFNLCRVSSVEFELVQNS